LRPAAYAGLHPDSGFHAAETIEQIHANPGKIQE
jgi:hypothetical protein